MYSTPPISMLELAAMMRSISATTSGDWRVGLDGDAGFGSIDGAGCAVEVHARRCAADVRRAQVEGFAGDMDFDGVEVFAVEDFDADDVSVFVLG